MGPKEVLFSFLNLATQKKQSPGQTGSYRIGFYTFHFLYEGYICCDTPLQVVQEYERAVIFRLGRLKQGGAKVQSKLP